MPVRRRAALAALLSIALAGPYLGIFVSAAAAAVTHASSAIRRTVTVATATPPRRIPVAEPVRVKPSFPRASTMRPHTVQAISPRPGIRVAGPPMLRPTEIDRVLSAARRTMSVPSQRTILRPLPVSPARAPAGMRRAQSLPSDPNASGTGVNAWWTYQAHGVPGGGHAMINVGTGNLVVQQDDMAVAHKAIAMSFRRTYNSQAPATVSGDLQTWQNLYGNGWTNTFDAHVIRTSVGHFSVFDIDGARYDYVVSNGQLVAALPGDHSSLVSDGVCGLTWTKKSGTVYYFWTVAPSWNGCPQLGTVGGYAGRLYQIIGRNRNTYITFNYSWDGGDASATGKINTITAQAESGLTATLSFADFSGRRLLSSLTWPDGATQVTYGYDANGNLTSVTHPPNNAAGTRPTFLYGYQSVGTDSVLQWIASPRWCGGSASGCGYDGGYLYWLFNGSSAPTSTVSTFIHGAVINPTINDGTNTSLHPGYVPDAYNFTNFIVRYYTTGVTTPTSRDTDGHMTNWVADGQGRVTQTQICTASVNQGTQCTGTWLTTNHGWDASNNLVSEIDPRGNETDYAYDANGNTIASAAPMQTTSEGTFRPTKLLDFDAYNNIVAYCDEHATHLAGGDWTSPPAPSDSRCSTLAAGVPHNRATYAYPSYQPYGELSAVATPLGYTRRFSYAASQQAGNDYGLPTTVTGDSFTQIDGTTITPTQTYSYDANGIVRCYNNGSGTTVISVDALGRNTSVADADDSSANSLSICGKTGGQPGWNTQRTYTYFPDGSVQTEQTAANRAGAVSKSVTYDLDGNVVTETKHNGCSPGATCSAGVTAKWYDGADRLVEVQLPHDSTWDVYPSNWLTRYIYDISQGGTVSLAGTSYRAYGDLYKTQEWAPPSGSTTASWQDLRGSSYDAAGRDVAKYTFSPSSVNTLSTSTKTYDASNATLGLLSWVTDPLAQTTNYTYDPAGRMLTVHYAGDGGVTPDKSMAYDAVGRVTSATGAVYGTETTSYDADGRVTEFDEPTSGSITSPARITYDYYPNGQRKDLNVFSSALNIPTMMSYAYRTDGMRSRLRVAAAYGDWVTSYTDGGRLLSQSDPFTGTVMPNPQAPVNPGTVYPPTSWAYDSTGQLTTLNLPQTFSFQSIAHDDEGMLTAWNGSSSANGPAGVQFTNTIRGENVMQSLGNQQSASFRTKIANGATVQAQLVYPTVGQPSSTWASPVIEPVNAVVKSWSKEAYAQNSDPEAPQQWIDCGPQVKTQNYDAASRLVSRTVSLTVTSTAPDCADAYPDVRDTPAYAYDAEDHHTTITSNVDFGLTESLRWSPTGQAYSATYNNQTYGVHYDGDRILFISDSNGALVTAKIETLANYTSSGLVAVDRGVSGEYVSQHNGTFYGGVAIGSTVYKNFQTQTTNSIPYIFYGSTNDALCVRGTSSSPAGCAGAPNMEYGRQEGWNFFGLTIQGKRAVEASTGQWTTPDAFAGTVHDPMSQKSFMWDNNNPYAYSDPTGFTPNIVATAEEDGSAHMATNGGAQPSVEVAKAGVANSPEGIAADVNNAIVTAYAHETAATTGMGKFKPGEMADVIANHLTGNKLNGGYDVHVDKTVKDSAHVSVHDPVSGYGAEITIHGKTTDVAVTFRGRELPPYGVSYRWQGAAILSKGYLEYHASPWPMGKWVPAILRGPWGGRGG